MKLIYSCAILLAISSIASCKKYLDKKSDSTLTVPTTIQDLQALLDDAEVMNNIRTPSFGETSADDYFLLQSSYDTRSTKDRHAYIWAPDEYNESNDWAQSYLPVYNANYCLEMIEKIPVTTSNREDWRNIKGSSLFFRAYYFLNIAWVYSKAYDETSATTDLGIVLRTTSDFNVPSVRASLKDTYEKIIKDAKKSIEFLPDIASFPYRPSKAASHGLLARTYLSMRQYDSARKYADLCLSINNQLMDFNNPDDVRQVGNVPFNKFNKETIFYSEMGVNFSNVSTSIAKMDTVLYASYNISDIRRKVYFRSSNGWRFKGTYAGSQFYLFTGIAVDEIFLIRAECYARKTGFLGDAINDLNALISTRWITGTFVPFTPATEQEALDIILTERRKELLMRGIRWSDIKRLNKEGANIIPKRIISGQTYTLIPNSNWYALPLPQEIINLTGLSQNPQ